ncbi:hypothetical protein DRN73_09015 [Candidatus Pacearchaeota archaeon]|nr:MAG: hypothetical protein DRN73_09015 [Candidatus Pacearchaeota archaeon]
MTYKQLSEKLMEVLSDKRLEPRPHFRILPNRYREEEIEKIWEPGMEKSEIGFIITDFNRINKTYTTLISFFIRIGEKQFAKVSLTINKSVDQGKVIWEIEYPNGNRETDSLIFNTSVLDISLPINLVKEAKILNKSRIEIRIIKNVKHTDNANKILFKLINNTPNERFRIGRKTYEFGHFLEYTIEEKSDDDIITKIKEIKGYRLLPQIIPTNEDIKLSSIKFLDYFIGEIDIPEVKSSKEKISIFSEKLKTKIGLEIEPEIIKYFEKQFESQGYNLYTFQQRAIEEIIKQVNSERKPVLITARTAAGKTEAFLFPILNNIISIKKKLNNPIGVKSFLMYPTKALANDQLQRIVEILYKLNQHLDKKITVGVYHGDIEEKLSLDIPLPLRCVKHEKERLEGKINLKDIRLTPTSEGILECPYCKEKYDFILVDRFKVLTELPDIIISTPDVLNYILIKEPYKHQIFGKSLNVKVCENCKRFSFSSEKACNRCGEKLKELKIEPKCSPEIIVLDELHLFSSLFGGNISKLLMRLEKVISVYSKEFFKRDLKIQYIASSATIKNPKEFGRDFFDKEISLIQTSDEDYEKEKSIKKIAIFVSPTAYKMVHTIGWACVELIRIYPDVKVLSFVNTRNICDQIVNDLKHRFSIQNVEKILNKIGAHYSYLSRQERADIEEKFNEGDINILISTSTLEVGVDFKDVDCLILYSAPYSFNSYLQRVGRAGRKGDAIIINVLNHIDPIDIFYYRHALEIVNNPNEFIEYPPFPKFNEKILNKHIVSSLYDFCSMNNLDTNTLFSTIVRGSMSKEAINFLESLWGQGNIKSCIKQLQDKYGRFSSSKEIFEKIEKDFRPWDLRKVEDHIEIEFESYNPSKIYQKRKKREYIRYRKAGLDNRDIKTLKKLKGR